MKTLLIIVVVFITAMALPAIILRLVSRKINAPRTNFNNLYDATML